MQVFFFSSFLVLMASLAAISNTFCRFSLVLDEHSTKSVAPIILATFSVFSDWIGSWKNNLGRFGNYTDSPRYISGLSVIICSYNIFQLQLFKNILICSDINFVCNKDNWNIFTIMFNLFRPFQFHIVQTRRAEILKSSSMSSKLLNI